MKANDGNLHVYQIGAEANQRQMNPRIIHFRPDNATREPQRGERSRARTGEWVQDEVAFIRRGEENAFEERDGLLRWMLAEFFLPRLGRRNGPHGFHLLAAVDLLHVRVIEFVARLGIFRGPDDGLGCVREVAAGKIGRGIGLHPGNIIKQLESELLHGEADGMNHVARAAYPDGAVRFQHALAGGEPLAIELMNLVIPDPNRVKIGAGQFVPIALVDAHHAAGVARDAVVREKIRRVGENQVDRVRRNLGEDFQAIALINFDAMRGIVKNRRGQLGRGVSVRRAGVRNWDGFGQFGTRRAEVRSAIGSLIESSLVSRQEGPGLKPIFISAPFFRTTQNVVLSGLKSGASTLSPQGIKKLMQLFMVRPHAFNRRSFELSRDQRSIPRGPTRLLARAISADLRF